MKVRLTKTQIDQLKPGPRRYEVRDTECQGLLVRVSPTGSKIYFHYYRDRRHMQHKHSLGSVTLLTLEQARDLARRRWYVARHGSQVAAAPTTLTVGPAIA